MILSLARMTFTGISGTVSQARTTRGEKAGVISVSVKWERGDVRLPLQHPNIRLGAPEAAQCPVPTTSDITKSILERSQFTVESWEE